MTDRKWWQDADTLILVAVYAGLGLVAAFAFGQSYQHIYDLGRLHAQRGLDAKMLPLSVDLLIVAAGLVMLLQRRRPAAERPTWRNLAWWLPRTMLYAGIGATITANVLYGLPFGYLSAGISAWPGVVFAGLVETVMVAVRPVQRAAVISAGQTAVPATALDAARAAYLASVAGANPLTGYQLHKRFSIPRSAADKIARAPLNGHADA